MKDKGHGGILLSETSCSPFLIPSDPTDEDAAFTAAAENRVPPRGTWGHHPRNMRITLFAAAVDGDDGG